MIELVRSLSWAQWGIALCGIGVVLFTLLSAGAEQRSARDAKEENDSLQREIRDLIYRQLELGDSLKAIQESAVRALSPEIRAESIVVAGDEFVVVLRNFSSVTIDKVDVDFQYSDYSGAASTATFTMAPGQVERITGYLWPNEIHGLDYSKARDALASGQRPRVVQMLLNFEWQGNRRTRHYTLAWTGMNTAFIR